MFCLSEVRDLVYHLLEVRAVEYQLQMELLSVPCECSKECIWSAVEQIRAAGGVYEKGWNVRNSEYFVKA